MLPPFAEGTDSARIQNDYLFIMLTQYLPILFLIPQTMSAKEKSKFEDMAKGDKARYEKEMKNYIPPKGEKKKKKDPNAPKRPP